MSQPPGPSCCVLIATASGFPTPGPGGTESDTGEWPKGHASPLRTLSAEGEGLAGGSTRVAEPASEGQAASREKPASSAPTRRSEDQKDANDEDTMAMTVVVAAAAVIMAVLLVVLVVVLLVVLLVVLVVLVVVAVGLATVPVAPCAGVPWPLSGSPDPASQGQVPAVPGPQDTRTPHA